MCCIIILSHFEFLGDSQIFGEFYKTYLHNATLAVDYFFMLSGFGIYLSSKRPECSIKGGLKFAVDKVKKIYPAYICSLLISIPETMNYFLKYSGIGRSILKLLAYLGVDLFLFQSFSGMTKFSHSVNGVCWFLSTLFICYMLCPWILRSVDNYANKRKVLSMICSFVILTLLLSFCALLIERNSLGKFDDLWYGHPFIRSWYLAIGMCVGYLYKESKIRIRSWQELLVAVIVLIYFFGRNSIPFDKGVLRVFDILLCIIFLYVFACGNGRFSKILRSEKMVELGKISMYLFVFHYPVRMLIGTVFTNNGWESECMLFFELFLIILFTSIITHFYCVVNNRLKNH